MLKKYFALIVVASMAAVLLYAARSPVGAAQTSASAALTGQVRSQEEGPMEGVLVTVKKERSTVAITVVSDARGRYSFPRPRLEPGRYALQIRAVGYELTNPDPVDITAHKTAQFDPKLRKVMDISSQLTNTEWFMSMPSTDFARISPYASYQKPGMPFVGFGPGGNSFADCITCHTMERIVRSRYTAREFDHEVLPRMGTWWGNPRRFVPRYPPGEPATPGGGGRAGWGEFMASINLSKVSRWEYPLKTLPRPKGKATRVIITEYDLPRRHAAPHDVVVDAEGLVWYGDQFESVIGVLDPTTAKVVDYTVPEVKPKYNAGFHNIEIDKDGNIWMALFKHTGVAKFDRKTKTFQTWPLPKELDSEHIQTVFMAPQAYHVDGKVWAGAGMRAIMRLDLQSGTWEVMDEKRDIPAGSPAATRPHGIYDIVSDSMNNVYELDIRSEYIVKVDAKTRKATYYPTPTLNSGPRRGHMDSQDRLWFAEHGANKVAMFDTKTGRFQEWTMPTPFFNPYDAILDKNEQLWTGGMASDRVARLNPKTGEFIEYLLPRSTNIRRVYVDNSNPVNFWVGGTDEAIIVKVEPLE